MRSQGNQRLERLGNNQENPSRESRRHRSNRMRPENGADNGGNAIMTNTDIETELAIIMSQMDSINQNRI